MLYDVTNALFKGLNMLKDFEVGMANGPRSGQLFIEFKGSVFKMQLTDLGNEETLEEVVCNA